MARIVYSKYSENNVFENKQINVICNQLMEGLTLKEFPSFNTHFALTGDAATCYKNSTDGPIEQIQFATDEREIYLYIAKYLDKICPSLLRLEAYEERLIAHFDAVILEFFLVPTLTTTNHNGIYTA